VIYAWQQSTWAELHKLYAAEKVPHAILLAGPRHSGLETLAGRYMQLLMCAATTADGACGSCRSCTLFTAGSHPDGFRLQPLEDSKQIVIEQVRNLVHQVTLTPIIARRKVAMLFPAEAMNRNSQNALLKTLEEPAGSAVIILVSNDPGRLLPTIRSRCRIVSQRLPDKEQVLAWLKETSPDASSDLLDNACAAAGNLPLLAQKYLTDDTLAQRREVAKVLYRIAQQGGNPLQAANSFSDYPKADLWLWLSGWMGALARALLSGGQSPDKIVEAFRLNLPRMTPKKALQLQQLAMQSYQLQDRSIRQDLLLADWLIQWQACR
jgi:DNA polymerase-3 subunit delta'